jgi:CubicO group peptidase (beta-lactamase class C family)
MLIALRRAVVITACFLFYHALSFAQTPAARILRYLDTLQHHGLFNGNVLIAQHGNILLRHATGVADAAGQAPLTPAYRFHIGSIAKEFDAVGLMVLCQQGKIDTSDKVAQFFPDLPSWARTITIRNLLQYTSGLPEVHYASVHGDADNWRDLYALDTLQFAPGTQYAYNNNNTFLRRQIIARVTGMPFNRFVETVLFPAAGIRNGIVDPTAHDTLIARSFDDALHEDALDVPISGWTALTIDDFYRWSQCINRFCLITPAYTAMIAAAFNEHAQSGLGACELRNGQVVRHVHDGSLLHYQALLRYDRAKDRTLILLNSRRHNNIYEIADKIEAMLGRGER